MTTFLQLGVYLSREIVKSRQAEARPYTSNEKEMSLGFVKRSDFIW